MNLLNQVITPDIEITPDMTITSYMPKLNRHFMVSRRQGFRFSRIY